MNGYSETDVFTKEDRKLLERAEEIVELLPDAVDGQPLRCHEVARVVGRLLELEVQDGKYGCVDHSWCVVRNSRSEQLRVLLDPYAIGRLPQVQLVALHPFLPHATATFGYMEFERRHDLREIQVAFLVSQMRAVL